MNNEIKDIIMGTLMVLISVSIALFVWYMVGWIGQVDCDQARSMPAWCRSKS